ncbi:HIRAN domain-containing protein [Pararhodospirillum oryzae]|uniref:HIRAN domain-containing protein n=1 Tax=Pararhodospirillum oryzae TaxID=478448 RepID=A0A512H9Z3_9PROT|nr:HIRAN domain-containing protein [Pararhodospirillum oryzae]GEO82248.1 hypothetical protein ROR02_23790 [Pararhodospirillum oryzae]
MENWIETTSEPRKLILAWQAPDHMEDRFRWAVGELEPHNDTLVFRYIVDDEASFAALNGNRLVEQLHALGYRGYPAFNPRRKEHRTGVLDAFMSRLPPPHRPDFTDYKRQFCLPPDLALSDFSLLGHTEAKLPSDGFSLVDPLNPGAERCDMLLEIAGYRYYADTHSLVGVGTPLEIRAEPDNPHDPKAVQVCVGGQKIGNINRLQAPTFRRWLETRTVSAVVQRLNGRAGRPRALAFVRVRPARLSVAA